MTNVRTSLLFSSLEKYGLILIQTGSAMVLARLLTPEEIGVFSVGAVAVGFVHSMRDFGISNYLIQEKNLTDERVRAALGITMIFAWGMGLALLALSTPISSFYSNPGVGEVIDVLAIVFFLFPFSGIVIALLRRKMQFGRLLWINTLSALAGAFTSIYLAATGSGFISLAWGGLAQMVGTLAAIMLLAPDLVKFLPTLKSSSHVLHYGSRVSLVSILTAAAESAPDLIIGRVLGFGPVGIFSKASSVVTMFNQMVVGAMMPVATPYFATRLREGKQLGDSYIHATTLVTGIAWPFLVTLALLAYPIVRILFGDQWDIAVPIVQILCISSIITAPATFHTPAFLSTGALRAYLYQTVILQPAKILLILVAAPLGLEAIGLAIVLWSLVLFVVVTKFLEPVIGVKAKDYARIALTNIPVTLVTVIAPLLGVLFTEATPEFIWVRLLAGGGGAVVLWVTAVFLFKHPIAVELASVWKRLASMRT